MVLEHGYANQDTRTPQDGKEPSPGPALNNWSCLNP